MSVQKRPKDNDDGKQEGKNEEEENNVDESLESWLNEYSESSEESKKSTEEQIQQNKMVQQSSQQVQKEKIEDLVQEFISNLPRWVDKPWMYVKPKHSGHLESWYDSWKDLILMYSKIMVKHIISVYELQNQHPFTNKNKNKNLSIDEMQYIIERMIEDNLAKWIDSEKMRVRIYYISNSEWADIIYNFTLEEGYAAEIMTIFELQQLSEDWSKLPKSELISILDILVKKEMAEWIDEEKESIKFLIT